jgi:hypothetical protein
MIRLLHVCIIPLDAAGVCRYCDQNKFESLKRTFVARKRHGQTIGRPDTLRMVADTNLALRAAPVSTSDSHSGKVISKSV